MRTSSAEWLCSSISVDYLIYLFKIFRQLGFAFRNDASASLGFSLLPYRAAYGFAANAALANMLDLKNLTAPTYKNFMVHMSIPTA